MKEFSLEFIFSKNIFRETGIVDIFFLLEFISQNMFSRENETVQKIIFRSPACLPVSPVA